MDSLKKLMPDFVLNSLRKFRDNCYNFIDKNKPYLNKINYCGFQLYYGNRSGIVNRIRFGQLDRIYERNLCENIVSKLEDVSQPIFLDIGANIGLISLFVLSKVPAVKIYAFEPGTHQYTVLGITVFANKLQNQLMLNNVAVCDKTGIVNFQVHEDEFESGGDGLIDTQRGGITTSISVPSIRLDDWWQNLGCPSITVIKIDTEGGEFLILKGAEQLLSVLKPVIFMEISPLNLKNYPYTAVDMLKWLKLNNYGLYTLKGTAADEHNIENLSLVEDSFMAKPLEGKI